MGAGRGAPPSDSAYTGSNDHKEGHHAFFAGVGMSESAVALLLLFDFLLSSPAFLRPFRNAFTFPGSPSPSPGGCRAVSTVCTALERGRAQNIFHQIGFL